MIRLSERSNLIKRSKREGITLLHYKRLQVRLQNENLSSKPKKFWCVVAESSAMLFHPHLK